MLEKVIVAAASAVAVSLAISAGLSFKLFRSLKLLREERQISDAFNAQIDKLKTSNDSLLEKINILQSRIYHFVNDESSEDSESDNSMNSEDEVFHAVDYLSDLRYNSMNSENSSFLGQSRNNFHIPSYYEAYRIPEPYCN